MTKQAPPAAPIHPSTHKEADRQATEKKKVHFQPDGLAAVRPTQL